MSMQALKGFVYGLPALKQGNPDTRATIETVLNEFAALLQEQEAISQEDTLLFQEQFEMLLKTLNTPAKFSSLKDPNHRALILRFIRKLGIEHYRYSYYNRAKLTKAHISRLEQIGPYEFSEAVMIACKINLINKNSSRTYIEDHLYTQSQSPVDMKIQQILKLCDEKKRSVNNNFKKLELMLEGDDYLEVVKELGKMLRDSWKKDKSKLKCTDVIEKVNKKQQFVEEPYIDQQVYDCASEKFQQKQQNQKRAKQFDCFSFTSSQKELIQQEKQYAKMPRPQEVINFQEIDSNCGERSEIFYKFSPLSLDYI